MTHFKIDRQSNGTLETNYPHTPSDLAASISDYVEAMFALGWEFMGSVPSDSASEQLYTFRANAQ